MTQQKESVVTRERFAQGQPYDEWIKGIDRNLERFQENYEGTHISDEDAAALKALVARPNGPARCLALGEAWCPDVFRGLPVMARIAEVSGMELRVFFRDQNNDIMAEFLKHGEHESIPTLVFYTKEHEYIAHWIERPAKANEEMSKLQELTAPLRNADITPEEREKHIKAYVEFQQGPIWAGWRDAAVSEIRQLLEDKVS
ncbi:MAG: thioredoxin family protein [Chloroflexi bacterium]|nr:thioredoxin family protein [Chloroflexota bacterium]MCH8009669.1 thioredoxin family protein [Chloroflexota bacterium]